MEDSPAPISAAPLTCQRFKLIAFTLCYIASTHPIADPRINQLDQLLSSVFLVLDVAVALINVKTLGCHQCSLARVEKKRIYDSSPGSNTADSATLRIGKVAMVSRTFFGLPKPFFLVAESTWLMESDTRDRQRPVAPRLAAMRCAIGPKTKEQ